MELDPLEITSQMIAAFKSVREAAEQAESEVSFRDGEYNDLTHALELLTFSGADGYKLAKQMQENRQSRRQAKNMREQIQPLYELMNRYQGFLKELKNVQAQIGQVRRTQQARTYYPRTRTDLQEAFNKAKKRKGVMNETSLQQEMQ